MRLLFDENLSARGAREVAEAGHDVASIATLAPSLDDRGVLALAREAQRVLVTFDSDFGDLVFRFGVPPPIGIVYLRMHPIDVSLVDTWILRALEDWSDNAMVVVSQDVVRKRPFVPSPSPVPGSQGAAE
jgi:predicted nuclease of predicted toxin-antitoxin system